MSKKKNIEKFITKENLNKMLGKIQKYATLVAPVEAYGDIVFQETGPREKIIYDHANCLNSPKDYIFLNDETLFKYDLTRPRIKNIKPASKKVVVFGSRACDTRAMGLLEKFFSKNLRDPLILKKKEVMTIITLMCPGLQENCFCTSVSSGPYMEEGFDIQLIAINEGYFLEASSSKGRDIVNRFSGLMDNINADNKKSKKRAITEAKKSKKRDFTLGRVYENLGRSKVKKKLWEDLSIRCQSCGGCLLLCPTCSCFYTVDKKINDKEGARVRSLDTCFYEGMTRMAGGYNPVSPKELMMKRKFYHKLWQQIDEFGESGCTGCGRCNDICPGNINWLDVIKRIEKKSA